jgi:hypothetical protein
MRDPFDSRPIARIGNEDRHQGCRDLSTPHWEVGPLLRSTIEALAAFFVAWAFPRRPAASLIALVLAVVVVATALLRTIVNGFGVPHMDSPVVGLALLPGALLVVAQLVAAYAVLRHRKPAA